MSTEVIIYRGSPKWLSHHAKITTSFRVEGIPACVVFLNDEPLWWAIPDANGWSAQTQRLFQPLGPFDHPDQALLLLKLLDGPYEPPPQ